MNLNFAQLHNRNIKVLHYYRTFPLNTLVFTKYVLSIIRKSQVLEPELLALAFFGQSRSHNWRKVGAGSEYPGFSNSEIYSQTKIRLRIRFLGWLLNSKTFKVILFLELITFRRSHFVLKSPESRSRCHYIFVNGAGARTMQNPAGSGTLHCRITPVVPVVLT